MPTSQHYQISKIVDVIIHLNPASVLDMGAGFGKYGVLCREYLELWDTSQKYRCFSRQIDAIEIFEHYITEIHKHVYSNIYLGHATDVLNRVNTHYELGLMIDVLEHFEKPDGGLFIKQALLKCECLVISTPKDIGHQGEVFENKHEAHLASWSAKELLSFSSGFRIVDSISHLVVLGPESKISRLRPIFAPSRLLALKRALKTALFE